MLSAILFDLDGTLLPMDMDVFTKGYFSLLAKKAAPAGYASDTLIQTIWRGTSAMVRNDGSMTNEERFWRVFAEVYGEAALADKRLFDDFYENEFREAVIFTRPRPEPARKALAAARKRAGKVILATNPIFPRVAVEARLGWIGLDIADFDLVTTYEKSMFCKPNPRYYAELLAMASAAPGEALMVGNDVQEDVIAASAVGIHCYLASDCLINRTNASADCASGSLEAFPDWLLRCSAVY